MKQLIVFGIERYLHILSGSLATFVIFPLAIFSRKGSQRHRVYGYASTFVACIVALSGTLMLLNPNFRSYWASNLNERGIEWQLFFSETFYEPAFFWWVNILLLYACFSAIRVWIRIKAFKSNAASFGLLDIILTLLLTVSSSFFVWVGYYDIAHLSAHPFAMMFIGVGLYSLAFSAIDIVSYLLPGQFIVDYGWILHGYKFLFAWHGLITAFTVRMRISSMAFSAFDTSLTLLGWLLTAGLFWAYLRTQRPYNTNV